MAADCRWRIASMQEEKDNLTNRFCERAAATGAIVERVPRNAEAINAALIRATSEEDVVLISQPGDVDLSLFGPFLKNPKVVADPTREQLATVRTGVTDSFCGVASTGSVCVPILNNLTSAASMLTRRHIVLVDSASIVPRPRDVFSKEYVNGKGLSRSFSFITGPSATADMGPLVIGVHGPQKVHIIVLE